jgi:hypothetical protein
MNQELKIFKRNYRKETIKEFKVENQPRRMKPHLLFAGIHFKKEELHFEALLNRKCINNGQNLQGRGLDVI